ncbi:LamG-like jellyroll fold domain-containing protein [Planctomycetota bacterium]
MKKTIILILFLALGMDMEVTEADYIFGTPVNLGPTVNSTDTEGPDDIAADGLSLFLTSDRPGGYGAADIWVATRSTTEDDWGVPVNLGPTVNSSDWDGVSSISADGLSLYFSSFRPGGDGVFTDIWLTMRPTVSDPWGTPINLGPVVNTSRYDERLDVSDDGLMLLFSSNRTGGQGQSDIWVTTRPTVSDLWGTPKNLGAIVNTPGYDGAPHVSSDGRMLFLSSNRSGGLGGEDIWVARRATKDDDWANPVNLGPEVNTSHVDSAPCLSPDGSVLYFMSLRPGGVGSLDLWQVSIDQVVDLNGDGVVDAADICIIVNNWGTDNQLCDIGPMPWGDGVVDVQDLIILAEHLFEDYWLIHHWTLDETEGGIAYDSAGDKNAVLHGDPLWQSTSGRVDGALALDGENDFLRTPFILDPSAGSFCVFAWIKGTERGRAIISQNDSTGFSQLWIGADPSHGRLMTRLMHPPFSPLISDAVITDGQWYHVGLMFDLEGLHRHLYVDGVKVAEDSDLVGGVALDGGLFIGVGEGINKATLFSGLIDDVRIYNTALSEEQIARLAQ